VGVLVGLDCKVWVGLGVAVGGGSAVGEVLGCLCCTGVVGREGYVVLNRVKYETSQIVRALPSQLPTSPGIVVKVLEHFIPSKDMTNDFGSTTLCPPFIFHLPCTSWGKHVSFKTM
jgi:hypothetical protein